MTLDWIRLTAHLSLTKGYQWPSCDLWLSSSVSNSHFSWFFIELINMILINVPPANEVLEKKKKVHFLYGLLRTIALIWYTILTKHHTHIYTHNGSTVFIIHTQTQHWVKLVSFDIVFLCLSTQITTLFERFKMSSIQKYTTNLTCMLLGYALLLLSKMNCLDFENINKSKF